jgi:arrestin-related trafficking adapter 1
MPHRVANFFRSSTENISSIKSGVARRVSPARRSGDGLDRQSTYASSISDDGRHSEDAYGVKMPDFSEQPHLAPRKHRISLPFGRMNKEPLENTMATLDWKIESPPIIFYGDADESTGALVSGQLYLHVKEDSLEVEKLGATLNVHVVQKRPFQAHCFECANQFTELKTWSFLSLPTVLLRGRHQFPFSVLLEGHLPASMDTPIVSIAYEFKAEGVIKRNATSPSGTATSTTIKFDKTFDVRRSIQVPETPHHSVRVFPPTNIKAGAHYTQVIHPTGQNNVTFRLDGLVSTNTPNNTTELWKLKKVAWKLEENIKTIAPACEKHAPLGPDSIAPGTKKGVQRVDTRILGEKVMHEGWKSDYTPNDGTVDFEFDYGLLSKPQHGVNIPKFACNSKSRDGTEVTHTLMIEMVVSKEWAPIGKPNLSTLTGTGRILRMHYHVQLTDHPGLGISWDNESPPVYQDVPPSPPAYPEDQCLISYDDLEPLEALRNSEEHFVR